MYDFITSLMLLGAIGSTDAYLPFWMTANQWGLMPERSGSLAVLQARSEFNPDNTLQWRWGSSLAVNNYTNPLDPEGAPTHLMVDELYGSLKWKVFTLDAGWKHRDLDFYGADKSLGSLSVTGGHVVESGNARTMPGYLITLDPVAVPLTKGRFFIYGAYGDYKPLEERYVADPLIHRTRIGFRLKAGERLTFDGLLDHYAVWGGVIPGFGEMKVNLENYLRTVTGRPAGADGPNMDRQNVIGDQGGSENFRMSYKGDGWTAVLQHDIPYNDGSGMGFQNFPDGVNTLSFSWDDKDRWLSDIVFEYHYTMYQSGTYQDEHFDENGQKYRVPGSKTTGGDNYFHNGEYKSCWTSYSRLIGDPLILPKGVHDGTWTSAKVNLDLENTRYTAHHLGLGGKLFRKHPYRLMLTRSVNYGTYSKPYKGESQWNHDWGTVDEEGLVQWSAAFNGLFEHLFGLKGLTGLYGVYLDRGELYQDSFGATLGIRYTFER